MHACLRSARQVLTVYELLDVPATGFNRWVTYGRRVALKEMSSIGLVSLCAWTLHHEGSGQSAELIGFGAEDGALLVYDARRCGLSAASLSLLPSLLPPCPVPSHLPHNVNVT